MGASWTYSTGLVGHVYIDNTQTCTQYVVRVQEGRVDGCKRRHTVPFTSIEYRE